MKVLHFLTCIVAFRESFASQPAARYGPQNCVSLSLSPVGSCVVSTNCPGVDLDHFEFAFDCSTPSGGLLRHSFGMGGFDPVEEFDTDVKCQRCTPPAAVPATAHGASGAGAQAANANFALQGVHASGQARSDAEAIPSLEDSKVVKYGPDNCVSVYKGGKHCIMKTACSNTNTTTYDFGLICVDKNGAPTRHLFGMDSFDPEETFDTLIECDQCFGLEDVPDDVALSGRVLSLNKEVKSLKTMMGDIAKDVGMLNKEVFPEPSKNTTNATAENAPNPGAPAAAPPADAAPAAAPASALVHHQTRKVTKRGHSIHKGQKARKAAHEGRDIAAVHRQTKKRSLRHRSHKHQEVAADAVDETDGQEVEAEAEEDSQEDVEELPAPKPRHHHHASPRRAAKEVSEDQDHDELEEDDEVSEPPISKRKHHHHAPSRPAAKKAKHDDEQDEAEQDDQPAAESAAASVSDGSDDQEADTEENAEPDAAAEEDLDDASDAEQDVTEGSPADAD